ncbi:SUN domain-containing ossification factor-like [Ornithodoros turicata]|uniref:SUN domain-containing ossification factor-like n=1 Tax=Ornithodoros turicata TaxID=34597 RepID=UPI003138CE34
MGLKSYIILLYVLLLGCGRCCANIEGLDQELDAGVSSDDAAIENVHPSASQLHELRVPDCSENSAVLESRNVQPTFTLKMQASDGMSMKSEQTSSFPSQTSFTDEASGSNVSSVGTGSLDAPEPSPEQSTLAYGKEELVTEVPSLELQESPAGEEAYVETAAAPEQLKPQSTVPNYKKGDVDMPVTDVPVDVVVTEGSASTTDKALPEDEKSQAAEKMPTFAEWKEKMLAGQEKGGDQVPDAPSAQLKKKASKGGRNYASYECGAKVLAANAEADGSGRILNEMMDEYMLNPCKAKIWFIIELCEIIQISQVELANFELFSSMPKEFSVSVSDRYPTREWTQLGVFTALDQKAVQSFKLQSDGYGKYIKVELLSRYGSEHYCPLSLFRVYGTSMLEDYEQLEDKPQATSQHNSEEYDEEGADRAEKSKNVVDRAKDAVMSILKVLRRDQEDNNSSGNISCSEDGRNCSGRMNASASPISAGHKLQCQLPRVVAPAFESCVVCSQLDHVAADVPSHTHASAVCHFLRAALAPVSDCVDDSLMLPVEEHPGSQLLPAAEGDSTTSESSSASPTLPTHSMEGPRSETSESPKSSQHSSSSSTSSSSSVAPSSASAESKPVRSASTSSEQSLFKVSTAARSGDAENVTASAQTFSEESLSTSNLQGSITTSSVSEDAVVPTPTIEALPAEVETSPSSVPSTRSEAVGDSTDSASEVPVVSSVLEENGILSQHSADSVQEGDVTREGGAREWGKPTELGSAPGNQKESVFMRINNRIKVLELNMSLSSQYLEELSQRYRKQMEDMQRNFNHTINALNETTRMAAEKDQRQQEALVQLQQQLDNLTSVIDALLSERRSISKEVFESHVCLIVIEAIVLATVFSLCLRRAHAVPLQQGAPDRHHMQRPSSRSSLKRRCTESEQEAPTTQVFIAEKKQKPSEDSISSGSRVVIVEPVVPIIMEPQPKEKVKKHKNKKQKGSKRKNSVPETGPDEPRQQQINRDVVDKATSAGVLFSSAAALSTAADSQRAHTGPTKIHGGKPPPHEQQQRTQALCIPTHKVPLQVVTQKWKDSTYGLCSQDTKLGLMKMFPHAGKTPV